MMRDLPHSSAPARSVAAMEEPDEDEAGVRMPDREVSASEADPFSDAGDALGDEEESGEDLHDEGQAVPMGCADAAF